MEWNNTIINDYNGETIVLCECKCLQEITETEVVHLKRDMYQIHYTCLCLECEMCWVESWTLSARGRDIKIIWQPEELE